MLRSSLRLIALPALLTMTLAVASPSEPTQPKPAAPAARAPSAAPATPAGASSSNAPTAASPAAKLAGAALAQAKTETVRPASSTAKLDRVVVAHVPIMSFATLYSAIDNGFMAEQGIQVELQRVASGTEAVGFLAKGQIDVGAIGLAAGTFNAFNRGFDMRIVATASTWGEKHNAMILGAADKVKRGEIRTLKDLKGRKVGIAGGAGSAGAYVVDAGLRTVGLTIKDVQVVSLPNADMPIALKNSSIDAGLAAVPFSNQAISEGWGVPLLENWEVGAATTNFLYSGKFMKERPEVAQRFMVALVQGSRAIQGARYASEKNLAIWEKHTGVKPEIIKGGIPLVYSPDMAIAKANLIKQEQGHREGGFTDYPVAIALDRMIDESYQQKALALLGPFKP